MLLWDNLLDECIQDFVVIVVVLFLHLVSDDSSFLSQIDLWDLSSRQRNEYIFGTIGPSISAANCRCESNLSLNTQTVYVVKVIEDCPGTLL